MTFRTAANYTYDAYARVRTFTDSEGWTVTYDYDAADRVTKVTYPDGTVETYTYKAPHGSNIGPAPKSNAAK